MNKGNFQERYLKRTQNMPLSQVFQCSIFMCSKIILFNRFCISPHCAYSVSPCVNTTVLYKRLRRRDSLLWYSQLVMLTSSLMH